MSRTVENNAYTSGITVPGGKSNQQFSIGYVRELETEKHVICLQIKGEAEGAPISKALTTKTRLLCDICGTTNPSKNNFCSECGTALIIF